MSEDQPAFDRVLALNNHLEALAAVGVPVALEAKQGGEPTAATLEKVNATLALRLSRGLSLDQALAADDSLPGVYRHALEAGLRSDHFAPTLDGLNRQARAGVQFQHILGQALVHPLIVFSLAYLGFIYMCLYVGPAVAAMYTQLGQQPSNSVQVLLAGREWMRVWVPLVPLAILLAWFLWWQSGSTHNAWVTRWNWLPGVRKYLATVKHAMLADQLARLTRMGVPLSEALRTAGPMTGDEAIEEATTMIADARERDEVLTSNQPELAPLPPLLRWSLIGDLGDEPLPDVLQFVAENYYQRAESRVGVLRVVVPALLGAVVGGSVVFVYALSLFMPLIQLLIDTSALPT